MQLDVDAARAAVGRLAAELGLGLEDCARGIVRVANFEMVRALRVMTVERGLDPRRFTLLAFGGAGPLHAAELAAELGITRILIPPASGVLSAVAGLLMRLMLRPAVPKRSRIKLEITCSSLRNTSSSA